MPTVAIRVTRGRRRFVNAIQVRRELDSTLDNVVKPYFVKQFADIVKAWRHKPDFKARKFVNADEIRLNVFPAGENKQIWQWVSRGTRGPYPIPKDGPRFLRFQTGYRARTKPGSLQSTGPGRAFGPIRQGIMQVQHPGIEGREFEKQILESPANRRWFSKELENAFRRGLRKM